MNAKIEREGKMLQEQVRATSQELACLVDELYHDGNNGGLETLIKNMELVLGHARECASCLEFALQGGDVLSKIKLMLEYAAHNGLTEDFVMELEDMTARAHDDLMTAREGGDITVLEDEVKRHWQAALRRHEELAESA